LLLTSIQTGSQLLAGPETGGSAVTAGTTAIRGGQDS
jgi:hypothetical protein